MTNKKTDNTPDVQESPTAAPPGAARKASKAPGKYVHCVAIAQFTHDDRSYHPARTEQVGAKTINHAADRVKLPRAWAQHHIKAGNVVDANDYDAWLAKQAAGGDA